MTVTDDATTSSRNWDTGYDLTPTEKRFILAHVYVAISALFVGSLFGPLQSFEHSGVDFYQYIEPVIKSYYQGLTLHGVLNALVWTTFFIVGFTNLTTIKGLGRPLSHPWVNKLGFWVMVVGLLMTAVPILTNSATVLYTFYPPLEANWAFYLGLTLVVVGSWIEGVGFYLTLRAWRKDNPGERSPFIALGGVINAAMWQIATLGVAVEILTMLLPWSLGMIDATDPTLARTYFWFTGHPLVYFWLLPAYVSWYGMLPKQVGGKLFSDSLARLAFWMFLIVSVPVGFHHQVRRPRRAPDVEVHPCSADLFGLLPVDDHRVHRDRLTRVRGPQARWNRPGRMDPRPPLERPVGHGPAPGRHPVHVRRGSAA